MRILLFGDDWGVPMLARHVPRETICGVAAAEIRPHQHEAVREEARRLGVPFVVQPRYGSDGYQPFVANVRRLAPDLVIVNSYSMILRPDILSIAAGGAVNIHGALLPQYRGANPVQWALINGETEAGATMHYVDEGIDTGDIIARRRVPIRLEDTWIDVREKIGAATEEMLAGEIPKLIAGTNGRAPQDESMARHWPRRKPEDGLIDWSKPVIEIYNLIRALVRPMPGAYYFDRRGEKVVLDSPLSLREVAGLASEQGGAAGS